jgi:DNA-binding FrmR family transcriptional regulator
MEPNPQADILRRLRCAEGHLNAVIEMAESGQPCEQVLHQLNAIQSALRATGGRIICWQSESMRDIVLNSDSFAERSIALKQLQFLYAIYVQHFNHTLEVNYG